jgi:rubrerythrin
MLAGKGFKPVYNLSGGIKAWGSETAVGPEDQGLELFTGNESLAETLIVAYGLEEGLREFYVSMADSVADKEARRLFDKLSQIEVKHQQRIVDAYIALTGVAISPSAFADRAAAPLLEGGQTTEDYLNRYRPNLEVAEEIVALAMGIEAQALDLYQRAAQRDSSSERRRVLMQIANEERTHLKQLGKLIDAL